MTWERRVRPRKVWLHLVALLGLCLELAVLSAEVFCAKGDRVEDLVGSGGFTSRM